MHHNSPWLYAKAMLRPTVKGQVHHNSPWLYAKAMLRPTVNGRSLNPTLN